MSENRTPYTFTFVRFNPRRHGRGKEAAEVKVTHPDGNEEYLWMSRADIRKNIQRHGECAGLTQALESYE